MWSQTSIPREDKDTRLVFFSSHPQHLGCNLLTMTVPVELFEFAGWMKVCLQPQTNNPLENILLLDSPLTINQRIGFELQITKSDTQSLFKSEGISFSPPIVSKNSPSPPYKAYHCIDRLWITNNNSIPVANDFHTLGLSWFGVPIRIIKALERIISWWLCQGLNYCLIWNNTWSQFQVWILADVKSLLYQFSFPV